MNCQRATVFVETLLALLAFVLVLAAPAAAQTLAATPNLGLTMGSALVFATAVQPDGKILIGGEFEYVNGQKRFDLARLNADGTLDASFVVDAFEGVDEIVVAGTTIYVRGNFTTIGGVTRNGLAAIDSATGVVKAWNPDPDGPIATLAVSGSTVYVGGFFTTIGGASRFCLAAIDASTGNATAWNPDPDDEVATVAVSGSTVYVGGGFMNIGGASRAFVAALDATSGNATAWNPDVDNAIDHVMVSAGVVYMAGQIHQVNGNIRDLVAAVTAAGGALTAWNPTPNNTVRTMLAANGVVYLGGEFTNAGGPQRQYLAAVDPVTGAATSWNPHIDASQGIGVLSLAACGATVCAGGWFDSVAGFNTLSFARFDAGTAALAPGFRTSTGYAGEVRDLARQADGRLVAVGEFQMAGLQGVPLGNMLRLNSDYTLDTSWHPSADAFVQRVAVGANAVYIAGGFTHVGGVVREALAAVDLATGAPTLWNPFPISQGSTPVQALVVSGNTVYVGGSFHLIGNTPPSATRHNVAAVDATLGNATPWNPNVNGGVDSIALSGSTVYVGGNFTQVGALPRNLLAAIDATTGIANGWNPGADGQVFVVAVSGGVVYAGGFFSHIGGQAKPYLAAIDASTGALTSWGAHVDGGIETIKINAGTVYVAGAFTVAGGPSGPNQHRDNVAAFATGSGNLASWNPVVADVSGGPFGLGDVFTVEISGNDVTLGGRFEFVMGKNRPGLARLGTSTAMASQRTFVASDGSDANACSIASPCATFAAAVARTSPLGEVIALDSGAFGPVVIDRPVTIAATPGQYAGITATSGTAVQIAAGAGPVTLRGLAINALGGATGIDFVSGDALYVDRVVVSGFTANGLVAHPAGDASVHVRDSVFRANGAGATFVPFAGSVTIRAQVVRSRFEGNGVGLAFVGGTTTGLLGDVAIVGGSTGVSLAPSGAGSAPSIDVRGATISGNANAGVDVSPNGGASASITLVRVQAVDNVTGMAVHAGGAALVGDSTLTRNATGVAATGGGAAVSSGDNRLLGNGVDGTFTSTSPKH